MPWPQRTRTIATSTKIAAAQSELQACETHLATKENELALRRTVAVRDGLNVRCQALVQCGWAWTELGKEAIGVLESPELAADVHGAFYVVIPAPASAKRRDVPSMPCLLHSAPVLITVTVQAPIDHDSYTSPSRITTTTSRFLRTKTTTLPWGLPGPRRRSIFRTVCMLRRALLRVSRTTLSLRTHIGSNFPQPMP